MSIIKINVKKLNKKAINPIKEGKEVMILTCTSKRVSQKYVNYGTGLSIDIPKGYAGILFPLDTIYSRDLIVKDSIGILNSENTDEIKIKFQITDENLPNTYAIGDNIAKLIILPIAEFEYNWDDNI